MSQSLLTTQVRLALVVIIVSAVFSAQLHLQLVTVTCCLWVMDS